jgi:type IV pilus assembly protein PilA
MKKINNNKGFTLIELLVVVAIIGILASVGVVAYNGYTASAQRGAANSNHNSVVKYIQAEDQKCNLEPRSFIYPNRLPATALSDANSMTCAARTGAEIITATVDAFDFANGGRMMNPYANTANAVSEAANPGVGGCGTDNDGDTFLSANDNTITVATCVSAEGDPVVTVFQAG